MEPEYYVIEPHSSDQLRRQIERRIINSQIVTAVMPVRILLLNILIPIESCIEHLEGLTASRNITRHRKERYGITDKANNVV